MRAGRRTVLLAAILVIALAAVASAQDFPKMKLRFGHLTVSTLPLAQVDQWFADELAKRTGGQITMEIYWAESVGKARELLNMAGQGAVDVAAVPPSYFPAQLPFLGTTNSLPLTMASAGEAYTLSHTLWKEFPAFQDEARRNNVWPLFFHVLNPYHLLCSKPIRSIEDLKGRKMRSWGEDVPRAWQAVGAVPVTVLPGEFYESLLRGSVDCILLSWDLMVPWKLYEVAKYASEINFGAIMANPQWYNLKKWEGFPPHVRKLLTDLGAEASQVSLAKTEEAERKAIDTMKAAGVQFIPFPDQAKFERMLPDFLSDWVKKMEKLGKGPEATAVANRWRQIRSR